MYFLKIFAVWCLRIYFLITLPSSVPSKNKFLAKTAQRTAHIGRSFEVFQTLNITSHQFSMRTNIKFLLILEAFLCSWSVAVVKDLVRFTISCLSFWRWKHFVYNSMIYVRNRKPRKIQRSFPVSLKSLERHAFQQSAFQSLKGLQHNLLNKKNRVRMWETTVDNEAKWTLFFFRTFFARFYQWFVFFSSFTNP